MSPSDHLDLLHDTEVPPRILIVEDENIVALDIKMHLRKYGFQVAGIFSSGEEVLAHIEEAKPDLILMDIKLQGNLDGLETSRIIKERYGLPVVFLTAFADEATLQRAKVMEPFGYIIKPFEEKELRTAIVIGLYRHSMEKKLRYREELFSKTLRSITDAVIVLDPQERIEYMNPVAESLLGQSLIKAQGKKFRDLFTLQPVILKLPTLRYNNLHEFQSNGKVHEVELNSSPLVDEKGERTGTVIILHEVTEQVAMEKALHQSEQQLRQAQKMEAIGRLAGGIAHDFNNLLTIILGYSRILLEDSTVNPQVRTNIEGIQQAAFRSIHLTRQLLTFSRHQSSEYRTMNLNQLVRDMEKMVRRLMGEEIRLVLSLDAEPADVYVDQGQMEQVIVNLVVNARDAINGVGTIFIQTGNLTIEPGFSTITGPLQGGEYVTLSIRDTGIGIPEHILPNIFEPFFSTKETGKGTGLGLSTVYGIVKQSKGGILVRSAPNQGSTFTVLLPLHGKVVSKQQSSQPSMQNLMGTETILIVEDEEYIRNLIFKFLSPYGYKILDAPNAGEALLLCEGFQEPIHLLVTDVILPHMDGRRLYYRLKQIIPSMKVLFISGYPMKILLEKGLLEEEDPFLQKPFDLEGFLQKVRSILDI
ncbi:MAG: response regulator [Spirochaetes bacterium]|nr:response regulator [Spirochaetota bacterium]